MKTPIYLDNNATTPLDPRVLDAMNPFFTINFGNPASSNHRFGWEAQVAVELAREKIADLINCEPNEIIFTSGTTESNNLVIKGVFEAYNLIGNHFISTQIEHKSVLDCFSYLKSKENIHLSTLPVNKKGSINSDELKAVITDKTIMISTIYANNEIGTVQNIDKIGEISKEKRVLFFSDGAQAVGKIPVDVQKSQIDLLTISGHKLYGPKGIGALFIRRKNPRVKLLPQLHGGGHEKGFRSGTLNVPAIVGLGKACDIAKSEMYEESERLMRLRDNFERRILNELPNSSVNGDIENRLPNVTNLSFSGIKGDQLLKRLKDIAVSSGSACISADSEPSYVLKALGLSDELAFSSIRFGLGRFNTAEEITFAATYVIQTVKDLKNN